MVSAVEASVRRMESHGQAEHLLEKELLEEVGTCYRLSVEQVVSALPPYEHGASIDVLDFVSNTSRDFLEYQKRWV